MRILWITNTPVGRHLDIIKTKPYSGGWLSAELDLLKRDSSNEIFAVTVWPVKSIKKITEDNISYIIMPGKYPLKYNPNKKENHRVWKEFISENKPDIIHIHGTEFPVGKAIMDSCPHENYVISIQGLVSIIERYFFAGIDVHDIVKNITLWDLLRCQSIFNGRRNYIQRGKIELNYLKRSKHVIGRTNWDYIHAKNINRNLTYHSCNETLRRDFYTSRSWEINRAVRYSIFISQGSIPLKGLHKVFQAVHLVVQDYPHVKVIVGGSKIIKNGGWKDKLREPGYSKYLRKLLKDYSLVDNVIFKGILNEQEMISTYLESHVFICPSSIENSPNSVGEAQLLGIPVIAARVGGIPEMISHEETGLLYRFEEYEALAYNIIRLFKDDDLASMLSIRGREVALDRHNSDSNFYKLLSIYHLIKNKG